MTSTVDQITLGWRQNVLFIAATVLYQHFVLKLVDPPVSLNKTGRSDGSEFLSADHQLFPDPQPCPLSNPPSHPQLASLLRSSAHPQHILFQLVVVCPSLDNLATVECCWVWKHRDMFSLGEIWPDRMSCTYLGWDRVDHLDIDRRLQPGRHCRRQTHCHQSVWHKYADPYKHIVTSQCDIHTLTPTNTLSPVSVTYIHWHLQTHCHQSVWHTYDDPYKHIVT